MLFYGIFLSDVDRDSKNCRWFLVFLEEGSNGLDELKIEIFYSALIFFDLFCSGCLFNDWSKSSFGDDECVVS
jgi:hypothetical protein